jgi:carbon-monoxide dehydrogenase small subunit
VGGPTPGQDTPASAAPTLTQRLRLALPRDQLWAALQDPALIASCVPGAAITSIEGDRIAGTLAAGLGPIRARFTGRGTLVYDEGRHTGSITGEGRDATTGTLLHARAEFAVEPVDETTSLLILSVGYGLRGALAQFARGPLVRAFAEEIAGQTAATLESRLRGTAQPRPPASALLLRGLWRWLRSFIGR